MALGQGPHGNGFCSVALVRKRPMSASQVESELPSAGDELIGLAGNEV